MATLTWRCERFDALSPGALYEILHLRNRVFVVEQDCVYCDTDHLDHQAWHLQGLDAEGALVAYTRLLAAGVAYERPAIGRVITAPEARRSGLGKALMHESIAACARLFGATEIEIGAQVYLRRFYEGFGFVQEGDEYLEDGIPHIHMRRPG